MKRYYLPVLTCIMLSASIGCGDEDKEPLNPGDLCTPGEMVCDHDSAMACIGYRWHETPCPYGCDSKTKICKPAPDSDCFMDMCVSGSDTKILRCENGLYVEERCPSDRPLCQGGMCVSEADIGECRPNEIRCTPALRGTQICGLDKQWKPAVPCGDGYKCDEKNHHCIKFGGLDTCRRGEVRCSADKKGTQSCGSSGKWESVVKCPDNQVCDPNLHICAESGRADQCHRGDFNCDLNGVTVCLGSHWSEGISCPAGEICEYELKQCVPLDISEAIPAAECRPGELRCSMDLRGVQSCTEYGVWGPVTKCSNDDSRICDAKIKMCLPSFDPECTDGEQVCLDGGNYVRCDHGIWMPAVRCSDTRNTCAEINGIGQCVECVPGATRCTPDYASVQICSASGTWGEPERCPESNICDPTAEACRGLGNNRFCTESGDFQVTIDGYYRTFEQCGSREACSEEGCCIPGRDADRCDKNGTDILKCERQVKHGIEFYGWSRGECYSECVTEDGAAQCIGCEKGTSRCVGARIQKCTDGGMWSEPKECDSDSACDASVNECRAKCNPGDLSCTQDGGFWMCIEGSEGPLWTKMSDCGSLEACNASLIKPMIAGCICDTGKSECSKDGSSVMRCVEKERALSKGAEPVKYRAWDVEACSIGTGCKNVSSDKAECSDCSSEDFRCDGRNLQRCLTGKWETIDTCDASSICDEDKRACVRRSCFEYKDENGKLAVEHTCRGNRLLKCENGVFVEDKVCKNGCSIDRCIESAKCVNDERRCSDDMKDIEICKNGKWEKASDSCSDSEVCVMDSANADREYRPVCIAEPCCEWETGCADYGGVMVIAMCINGKMENVGMCNHNYVCKEGACVLPEN